jgi:hypothetical protein
LDEAEAFLFSPLQPQQRKEARDPQADVNFARSDLEYFDGWIRELQALRAAGDCTARAQRRIGEALLITARQFDHLYRESRAGPAPPPTDVYDRCFMPEDDRGSGQSWGCDSEYAAFVAKGARAFAPLPEDGEGWLLGLPPSGCNVVADAVGCLLLLRAERQRLIMFIITSLHKIAEASAREDSRRVVLQCILRVQQVADRFDLDAQQQINQALSLILRHLKHQTSLPT